LAPTSAPVIKVPVIMAPRLRFIRLFIVFDWYWDYKLDKDCLSDSCSSALNGSTS
jgi:hypothetical protein